MPSDWKRKDERYSNKLNRHINLFEVIFKTMLILGCVSIFFVCSKFQAERVNQHSTVASAQQLVWVIVSYSQIESLTN